MLPAGSTTAPLGDARLSPIDPAFVPVVPVAATETVHVALGAAPTDVTLPIVGVVPPIPLVARAKVDAPTPDTGSENVTVHVNGPAFTDCEAPARTIDVRVGRALSMMTVRTGAMPRLPAASACVADTAMLPSAATGAARVSVQVPAVHGAAVGVVADPLIRGLTVAESPGTMPHSPPIDDTEAFVLYGNTRVAPFTVVTVTTGAAVSVEITTTLLGKLAAVHDR